MKVSQLSTSHCAFCCSPSPLEMAPLGKVAPEPLGLGGSMERSLAGALLHPALLPGSHLLLSLPPLLWSETWVSFVPWEEVERPISG